MLKKEACNEKFMQKEGVSHFCLYLSETFLGSRQSNWKLHVPLTFQGCDLDLSRMADLPYRFQL